MEKKLCAGLDCASYVKITAGERFAKSKKKATKGMFEKIKEQMRKHIKKIHIQMERTVKKMQKAKKSPIAITKVKTTAKTTIKGLKVAFEKKGKM